MKSKDFVLNKKYFINIDQWDEKKIIDTFQTAQVTQLPIIRENKIVGILDLYNFIKRPNTEKRLEDIINKDIVIATEDYDILNFKSFGQDILPCIDESMHYLGYIKSKTIEEKKLRCFCGSSKCQGSMN